MRKLQDPEYSQIWDAFYARFNFRPGVNGPFPGIDEPNPSVTLSLRVNEGEFLDELEELIRRALGNCTLNERELYYLDWQHECFAFSPNDKLGHWPNLFPDGDYAIFLAEDLSYGTFGHPWEDTICCFGEAVVRELLYLRADLPDQCLRLNGVPRHL